jgi:hypothetical protein
MKNTLATLMIGLLACLHIHILSGPDMSEHLYRNLKKYYIHLCIPKWMFAKLKVESIKYETRVPTTGLLVCGKQKCNVEDYIKIKCSEMNLKYSTYFEIWTEVAKVWLRGKFL